MAESVVARVQTVCGVKDPSELGITLTHEHLLIDADPLYVNPPQDQTHGIAKEFTLPNLGWIRYYPYSHKENLQLNSEELALKEVELFAKIAGKGATIVDVTTEGIRSSNGRAHDLQSLRRIAQTTGVNIICGTGYYVDKAHPLEVKNLPSQELSQRMVKDIVEGIDSTGIKAGVIGEIGCSWPVTENEKKVLIAAADAQRKTGAPLIIHPGRNKDSPMQILEILQQAGAVLERTVMSHLDRTVPWDDLTTFKKIATTGVILELDLFGIECSYYQQNESGTI